MTGRKGVNLVYMFDVCDMLPDVNRMKTELSRPAVFWTEIIKKIST